MIAQNVRKNLQLYSIATDIKGVKLNIKESMHIATKEDNASVRQLLAIPITNTLNTIHPGRL
jgi:hypothetical protein